MEDLPSELWNFVWMQLKKGSKMERKKMMDWERKSENGLKGWKLLILWERGIGLTGWRRLRKWLDGEMGYMELILTIILNVLLTANLSDSSTLWSTSFHSKIVFISRSQVDQDNLIGHLQSHELSREWPSLRSLSRCRLLSVPFRKQSQCFSILS